MKKSFIEVENHIFQVQKNWRKKTSGGVSHFAIYIKKYLKEKEELR
jgi:hypothetical protein